MSSGCGCKEVYRFPPFTYPYSSCVSSFLQQNSYFLFISSDGHQLYDFKERGVDLEVEGVRYIEMHRGLHTRLLQGAEISN